MTIGNTEITSSLTKVVKDLLADFTKQLRELTVPELTYCDGLNDWAVLNVWNLNAQVSIFDEYIEVDVSRLWKDLEDGIFGFDPRPKHTGKVLIKLAFDLEKYSRDDWNAIVDELDKRLAKHSMIRQK